MLKPGRLAWSIHRVAPHPLSQKGFAPDRQVYTPAMQMQMVTYFLLILTSIAFFALSPPSQIGDLGILSTKGAMQPNNNEEISQSISLNWMINDSQKGWFYLQSRSSSLLSLPTAFHHSLCLRILGVWSGLSFSLLRQDQQSGTWGGSNILELGSNILEPLNLIFMILGRNEEGKFW